VANVSAARAPVSTDRAATDSVDRLALALLGSGTGNRVFSPYSIQIMLAIAYQGAAGRTATEIRRVLASGDAPRLGASDAALARTLSRSVAAPAGTPSGDAAQLNVADGLWVQSGLVLEPGFDGTLANDFAAAPQTVDFNHASEAARGPINGWVSDHTAGRITNLTPDGTITSDTRLTLADAVYLNAHWQSPFVDSMTARRQFFRTPRASLPVPFMTQPATDFALCAASTIKRSTFPTWTRACRCW
jgi:serpin B